MELSFEEFGNDLSYEKNSNNLSSIYYLRDNLREIDMRSDRVSLNDESFSLAFRFTFNYCVKENKIRKYPLFNVTEKILIPDIYRENQIINIIRSFENISEELKESILKKGIECAEYQKLKESLESNPNSRNKRHVKQAKKKAKVAQGRKKKDDSSKRNHNTYSPNNLTDKIKNIMNFSLITTINGTIDSLYSKEEKIQLFPDLNLPQKRIVQVSENIIKNIDYNIRANRTNKGDN